LVPQLLASQVGSCITATNAGLTTLQERAMNGRHYNIQNGGQVVLTNILTRGSVDRFLWSSVGVDRGSNGLNGKCLWMWGLRSTDTVSYTVFSVCEYLPGSTGLTPLNFDSLAAIDATPTSAEITDSTAELVKNCSLDVTVANSPSKVDNRGLLSKIYDIYQRFKKSDLGQIATESLMTAFGMPLGVSPYFKTASSFTDPIQLNTTKGYVTLPPVVDLYTFPQQHPLAKFSKAYSALKMVKPSPKDEEKLGDDGVLLPTPTRSQSRLR
jgi:hypothetical protein